MILAVVDFFTCSISIPWCVLTDYAMESITFAIIRSFLVIFPVVLSTLIITTIAFERFFSICYPHRRIFNSRRVKITVVVLTFVSFIFSVFRMLSMYYLLYSYILISIFFTCLAIIVILYSLIFCYVYTTRARTLEVMTMSRNERQANKLSAQTCRANIHTAFMLFVVAAVFAGSYMTHFLLWLSFILDTYIVPRNIYYYTIFFFNFVANPFIYTIMCPFFRKKLQETKRKLSKKILGKGREAQKSTSRFSGPSTCTPII